MNNRTSRSKGVDLTPATQHFSPAAKFLHRVSLSDLCALLWQGRTETCDARLGSWQHTSQIASVYSGESTRDSPESPCPEFLTDCEQALVLGGQKAAGSVVIRRYERILVQSLTKSCSGCPAGSPKSLTSCSLHCEFSSSSGSKFLCANVRPKIPHSAAVCTLWSEPS